MKIKVKPKEGVKVVIPDTNPMRELPADGMVVESSTYWHRRLAEGDVVLLEEVKDEPVKEEKQQPLDSGKPGKSK